MNRTMILYSLVLMFGVFISTASQVLLKKSAKKHYDTWWKEYLNPLVFFAYLVFFGATFCSIFAYREIPLSLGPLLDATGYIYISIFGVVIFKERMNSRKILSLLLIIIGIAIYAVFG